MKRRQRDKILKIVARQINSGDFTKLKPVHFRCVDKTISGYIEKKYFSEFRPWWYEQFDHWGKMTLGEEYGKFFDKTLQEIQKWTGIDMDKYHQYFELNHKKQPKKERSTRKPRKEKEQPIRRLRNPQEFKIRLVNDGELSWENILGELAFQYRGYEFFIAHLGEWVVSDVAVGCRIAGHARYKMAIQIAKERIEKNFDKYVAQVERFREEATA